MIFPPLRGVAINEIPMPQWAVWALYCAAFGVFAVFFLWRARRGIVARRAVTEALWAAFISAAILYAALADLGWAEWVSTDARRFGGMEHDQKLRALDRGFYDDAMRVRRWTSLEGRYLLLSVRDAEDLFIERLQYHLLPALIRGDALTIVVFDEPSISFDPGGRRLMREAHAILPGNVELLERINEQLSVYRRLDR